MFYQQQPLTDQDIVRHLYDDFTFPEMNPSGEESLALSRDFGSVEAIQMMVQIHNLVEQSAKSEQPAIKFETTIYGRRSLGYTLFGERLYQILLGPDTFCSLPKQQLSEAIKRWEEVVPQILGQDARFYGDPVRRMNDQGVTEGELVNALGIRLAEGVRRKAHQLARDQRKKDAQRLCTARTKLISQHLARHSGVFGMRAELMYQKDYAEKVREKDSAEHIQGLIEDLQDDPWFGQLIAYFWNRNFISEAGYRTTLFLLFDSNTTPIDKINGTGVLQQWEERTKGSGLGYIQPERICNVDEILRYIECSKLAAQYLRLKPDTKFPPFGMSNLPGNKPLLTLEQTPGTNRRDHGGFGWSQTDLGAHLNNRFK